MNFRVFKNLSLLAVVILFLNASSLSAQTFTVLHTFGASSGITNLDGVYPRGDLVLAGGTLYGTAYSGGPNGYGTVFSVGTNGGSFSLLYSFTAGADGAFPLRHLVLGGNTLYGTAGRGNIGGYGSIFSVGTNGGFATVYSFSGGSDGSYPGPGLLLRGNTLYGSANQGGANGCGTVFSVNTNGSNFALLHTFGGSPDGKNPFGGLVLSGSMLYSTAQNGGLNSNSGFGTLFSIDVDAMAFTLLHAFSGHTNTDGQSPQGGLVLSSNTLYGTTFDGGSNSYGTVYSFSTGTSNYAVLRSFSNGPDGAYLEAGLAVAGNTLYGATLRDGASAYSGTLFSLNTDGSSFTLLHAFSAAIPDYGYTNWDGAMPYGELTVLGNVLYGAAQMGGANGSGTVFSLAIEPAITNLSLAGTNAVLNGINSIAGHTYTVLTSTNLALPLNQWTPVATNLLNSGGDFSITATNAVNSPDLQQYYILRTQ
jgi:uncharacterized repeat protein (TIGR03803 family)